METNFATGLKQAFDARIVAVSEGVHESVAFAPLPHAVAALPGKAPAVYVFLLEPQNRAKSAAEIADALGCSQRTVFRALKALTAAGQMLSFGRRDPVGGRSTVSSIRRVRPPKTDTSGCHTPMTPASQLKSHAGSLISFGNFPIWDPDLKAADPDLQGLPPDRARAEADAAALDFDFPPDWYEPWEPCEDGTGSALSVPRGHRVDASRKARSPSTDPAILAPQSRLRGASRGVQAPCKAPVEPEPAPGDDRAASGLGEALVDGHGPGPGAPCRNVAPRRRSGDHRPRPGSARNHSAATACASGLVEPGLHRDPALLRELVASLSGVPVPDDVQLAPVVRGSRTARPAPQPPDPLLVRVLKKFGPEAVRDVRQVMREHAGHPEPLRAALWRLLTDREVCRSPGAKFRSLVRYALAGTLGVAAEDPRGATHRARLLRALEEAQQTGRGDPVAIQAALHGYGRFIAEAVEAAERVLPQDPDQVCFEVQQKREKRLALPPVKVDNEARALPAESSAAGRAKYLLSRFPAPPEPLKGLPCPK